jgi:glutathionylspermidine synthase
MSHLNMHVGDSSKKWLLGINADGSQVSREEAAIIFWAWLGPHNHAPRIFKIFLWQC